MNEQPIMLPRLGASLRTEGWVIRHRCWRDRIPFVGKRHLLAMIEEVRSGGLLRGGAGGTGPAGPRAAGRLLPDENLRGRGERPAGVRPGAGQPPGAAHHPDQQEEQ